MSFYEIRDSTGETIVLFLNELDTRKEICSWLVVSFFSELEIENKLCSLLGWIPMLSFVPEEVFPMCFPSLAHVGRFMALCPSTLCLFVLWLWLKCIMSLLAKVNIKLPFWWFWGDMSRLRELTQKWVLRLDLCGVISSFDFGWSHPSKSRFPYSCLKRGKRAKGGAHCSRRLLFMRGGAFELWTWGLLHEERKRRPLASIIGSLEQHSSLFYWRDS